MLSEDLLCEKLELLVKRIVIEQSSVTITGTIEFIVRGVGFEPTQAYAIGS